MSEKLIEKLSSVLGRRSFLGRLSSAAAAAAALALGLSETAQAKCGFGYYTVACCCLCKNPQTCNPTGAVCMWPWTCEYVVSLPTNCRLYTCKEYYSTAGCQGDCTPTVFCSRASYSPMTCH